MSITFQCKTCHATHHAKEEHAGRQTKCPACGKVITIPAATTPLPAAGASISSFYEEELDVSPSKPQPSMTCPACATLLPPGAVICVKCGMDLRSGRRLETAQAASADLPQPRIAARRWLMLAIGLVGIVLLATGLYRSISHHKYNPDMPAELAQFCNHELFVPGETIIQSDSNCVANSEQRPLQLLFNMGECRCVFNSQGELCWGPCLGDKESTAGAAAGVELVQNGVKWNVAPQVEGKTGAWWGGILQVNQVADHVIHGRCSPQMSASAALDGAKNFVPIDATASLPIVRAVWQETKNTLTSPKNQFSGIGSFNNISETLACRFHITLVDGTSFNTIARYHNAKKSHFGVAGWLPNIILVFGGLGMVITGFARLVESTKNDAWMSSTQKALVILSVSVLVILSSCMWGSRLMLILAAFIALSWLYIKWKHRSAG